MNVRQHLEVYSAELVDLNIVGKNVMEKELQFGHLKLKSSQLP